MQTTKYNSKVITAPVWMLLVLCTIGCTGQTHSDKPIESVGLTSSALSSERQRVTLKPGPDRLVSTGLAAGTQNAFGFPLPAVMPITMREAFRIQAEANVSPSRVVSYVKQRVSVEPVIGKDGAVVFENVIAQGQTEPRWTIEVQQAARVTRLIVHSLALPRNDPLPLNPLPLSNVSQVSQSY